MSGALDNFFKKTANSIAESIILDIDPDCEHGVIKDAGSFIYAVFGSMQPLYRFGLIILAFGFNFYVLVFSGRIFFLLPPEKRLKFLRQWQSGPIIIFRDFVRFFTTMTILFYYDSDRSLTAQKVDIKKHHKMQCFYAGQ